MKKVALALILSLGVCVSGWSVADTVIDEHVKHGFISLTKGAALTQYNNHTLVHFNQTGSGVIIPPQSITLEVGEDLYKLTLEQSSSVLLSYGVKGVEFTPKKDSELDDIFTPSEREVFITFNGKRYTFVLSSDFWM
ncbi:hypothetical protein P0J00_003436 [Vibrio vulnificus]|nr:hypothetical protein [Vibrio vulnificus]EKO5193479.1 hypothetical protein [Vibrio vulnificus]